MYPSTYKVTAFFASGNKASLLDRVIKYSCFGWGGVDLHLITFHMITGKIGCYTPTRTTQLRRHLLRACDNNVVTEYNGVESFPSRSRQW